LTPPGAVSIVFPPLPCTEAFPRRREGFSVVAVADLTAVVAPVPVIEFLTTDADGAGVTDEVGLFTPAADARRPLPVFFVLDEV